MRNSSHDLSAGLMRLTAATDLWVDGTTTILSNPKRSLLSKFVHMDWHCDAQILSHHAFTSMVSSPSSGAHEQRIVG
eukprot:7703971-Karenia_brevis.AAC.1